MNTSDWPADISWERQGLMKEGDNVNENQIYVQLFKTTILNDEKTEWLVKEGYLGEYDPTYITKKANLFIAEFEKKLIDKVVTYININGLISREKLRDITALEPDAFDLFIGRMLKTHKLLIKKPGDVYVVKKANRQKYLLL